MDVENWRIAPVNFQELQFPDYLALIFDTEETLPRNIIIYKEQLKKIYMNKFKQTQ